ncbi:MAG: hypothetical protein CMJ25_28145 [Phycisphaerae bacterium]|nr:hypothetical protein [Phycisphaerae bacterium]
MYKDQIKAQTLKLIFFMNLENKMKYPDEIDEPIKKVKTKSNDGLTPKSRYRLKNPEKIKELNKKYYSAEYHKRYRESKNNNMLVKNNENQGIQMRV